MGKITNGQNVENFEKREKLRIAIIITSIITIILAVLSIAIDLGIGYAIVFFCITYYLKWKRNKLEIVESDLVKAKKEAKKTKKKKKDNEIGAKATKKNNK